MNFPELLAEIQSLRVLEKRALKADYLEVVVEKENLESLCKVLAVYFGAPLKPAGQSPSSKANQLAKPYGGIRKDQTMYYRQDSGCHEYALLWPWGSGARVTAKIILAPPSPQGRCLSSLWGRLCCRKS